jgi:phosphoribosylglycinamide formyltransferase-1
VASHSLTTIAVFASGQGGNFEALVRADREGTLGGSIAALFCDVPPAPVCERARRLGIEVVTPLVGRFRTRLEDESPWLEALDRRGVGTLALAGFMRRLHAPLLGAYRDRILNVHPSLLPAFPGLDAIAQAYQHGAKLTGCTVHLVDEGLDEGPILAQAAVEVGESDTLETLTSRIHAAEHSLYPATVRRFLTESWQRQGRRVRFAGEPAAAPPREVRHA